MSFAAPAAGQQSALQGAEQSHPQLQQIMQLLGGMSGHSGGVGWNPQGGQAPPSTPQFGLWGTPNSSSIPSMINSQMPGNVPSPPTSYMTPASAFAR